MFSPSLFGSAACTFAENDAINYAGANLRTSTGGRLDSRLIRFTGAYAYYLVDTGNEDLAIADLACAGSVDNGVNNTIHQLFIRHNFNLYFRQEIHYVFGAAIEFSMTFLPAEPLYFGNGQAGDTDLIERLAHFVELEWFYDGLDFFHGFPAVKFFIKPGQRRVCILEYRNVGLDR